MLETEHPAQLRFPSSRNSRFPSGLHTEGTEDSTESFVSAEYNKMSEWSSTAALSSSESEIHSHLSHRSSLADSSSGEKCGRNREHEQSAKSQRERNETEKIKA